MGRVWRVVTLVIERIKPFRPIRGDDLPITSQVYRDVPDEFKITRLQVKAGCPLTEGRWAEILETADAYFQDYEIVGTTYVQWFNQMQTAYYLKADMLESFLRVYNDDINQPTQSRTITRRHTGQYDTSNERRNTDTNTINQESEGNEKDIKLAFDSTNRDPSNERDVANTTVTDVNNVSVENNQAAGNDSYVDEEEWSDVGVAPNYTLMNGYLDNSRSYCEEFIRYIKPWFTMREVLKW